jgi:hypothetical protein
LDVVPRHTEQQLIGLLWQADRGRGDKRGVLRCEHGLSEASHYLRRNAVGGMNAVRVFGIVTGIEKWTLGDGTTDLHAYRAVRAARHACGLQR